MDSASWISAYADIKQNKLLEDCIAESTDPLLSWLQHTFVGIKQRSNIKGLGAPDVSMNSPVEGELQAPSV